MTTRPDPAPSGPATVPPGGWRSLRRLTQWRDRLPAWAIPAASAVLAVCVVAVTFHARIVLHAYVDTATRGVARDRLIESGLSLLVLGVPLLLVADARSLPGRAGRLAVIVAMAWWLYIRWSVYGWKSLSYW